MRGGEGKLCIQNLCPINSQEQNTKPRPKMEFQKVFLYGVLFLNFLHSEAILKLPGNEKIPALILFGDSIVDTGSNNQLLTAFKCNFPPYGVDFRGGQPTGRFSNGKVPSDLIGTYVHSFMQCFHIHLHLMHNY